MGYHFLMLVRGSNKSETQFKTLMKGMDVVPLFGKHFNIYAPLFLLVMMFLPSLVVMKCGKFDIETLGILSDRSYSDAYSSVFSTPSTCGLG